MKSLSGELTPQEWDTVTHLVNLRFKNPNKFLTAESLILYEQRILDEEKIFECCVQEHGIGLEKPKMHYLSNEVILEYDKEECIPFRLDTVTNELHIMTLIEYQRKDFRIYKNAKIVKHYVPLYYYVAMRTKYYRKPDWLYEVAEKDIFDYIMSEAISLGAIDITIASRREGADVYYNVAKKKVYSKRTIAGEDVATLVTYIAGISDANFEESDVRPKYMNTPLDIKHRGRTCIKDTIWGKAISIRVLDNDPLDKSLEELNLTKNTIDFIRNKFADTSENGLRLMIGPTMSGKNTTIIAMLREMLLADDKKICTVEMPVEIFLDGAEQTSVDDEELYNENAIALLRENPDVCYLSEITNYTAVTILTTANTAKPVYSSLHANSIPDIISRLVDLTGFSIDRVITCLHSVIFQNLERDEINDVLYPVNKSFYFSQDVKLALYGRTLGEVQKYFAGEDLEIIV